MASPKGAGLPPLVGLNLLILSLGVEQPHERARTLEAIGYRVSIWSEPTRMGAGLKRHSPAAIIVDLAHEVAHPSEIVRRARRSTDVPMLVVGCAGTAREMSRCFEAGADDYVRPRCPSEEIDLRLRALFRRIGAGPAAVTPTKATVARIGDLEVNLDCQTVKKSGRLVALTPIEFRLLATLAENEGRVMPAKALIARVWGNDYVEESHYLRLYVRYLRRKLEDDPANPRYILNRWGAGYSLAEPPRAA